jgi:ComF family protein
VAVTQKIGTLLQRVTQHALDSIFPPRCVACQKSGAVLCPSCLATIHPIASPFCVRCQFPLASGSICQYCTRTPPRFYGLRVVSRYEGVIRACIHKLKYEGQARLAVPLGLLLAQAYIVYGLRADIIVPVPLHAERLRQRGYNQSQLLAEECAKHIHAQANATLLVKTRATPAQVGLSAQERILNVAGSFATSAPLHGQRIVLIDDVCTTGATLNACTEALRQAGAGEIWGLALARPYTT